MSESINEFQGEYRWLSNFWTAPIEYKSIIYPSVEHAYQAAKTHDIKAKRYIATLTAGQAKRYGKTLVLRKDWEDVKVLIMRDFLMLKFSSHPYLKEKLIDTGSKTLIEGNKWGDTFWGVCNGAGNNMLGTLLMEIRECFRRKEQQE